MHTNEDLRMRGIVPAIAVIAIGVLLLLRNMDIVFVQDLWRFWPGLLIAAGLVRLVDAHNNQNQVTGGILVGGGAILLANTLGFLHLTWNDAWPLVLIGAGIVMLYTRLVPPRQAAPRTPGDIEGSLNECAVFGGVSRKLTTDDFHGGQVSAMCGGVEIDLRRANMRGDSATIDVSVIFGGVEFKVPPNWIVTSQMTAVFGGIDIKCVQPAADMPGVKRLYVSGSATFGGIEFKN
jgi:predicted membrane protein